MTAVAHWKHFNLCEVEPHACLQDGLRLSAPGICTRGAGQATDDIFIKGKMSSPGSRRNSCRAVACGTRLSSEGNTRRRGSSVSYLSSGAQTEDLSVSLNQPIITITFRFLLAVDLWLSKRLGVCACEESAWGSIRPLVRLVEFSGHVVPWLIGTVYTLLCRESVVEQEIMLNLFLGKRSNLRVKISTCVQL